jgi:hypothetical protein
MVGKLRERGNEEGTNITKEMDGQWREREGKCTYLI